MQDKKTAKKQKPLRFFLRRIYPGKDGKGKDGKPTSYEKTHRESG